MIDLYDKDFYSLKDYPGEIWKNIEQFGDLYQVSNYGRIKRKERTWYSGRNGSQVKTFPESIVKQRKLKDGYVKATLCCDGVKKSYSVHVLVAKAFVPNPLMKPQVNHKNLNRSCNFAENLEWVTCSENILHSYKKNPNHKIAKNRSKKLNSDEVFCIRKYKIKHPELSIGQIAKIFNISYSVAIKVINHKTYNNI